MSIQTIINSAQTIDFTRGALVASTMSRSGRLLTAARNWTKPWTFTITPKPVWKFADNRGIIETILNYDKTKEYVINLADNSNMAWMVQYQGAAVLGATGLVIDNTTDINSTILVLRLGTANIGHAAGTILLKAGDIIQPYGHRYPYVVVNDVSMPIGIINSSTKISVTLNRALLAEDGYSFADKTLVAGVDCRWHVKVTKLPKVKFFAKDFIQFTDDFEITEVINGVST
jgi:hypothetical protein